MTVENLQIIHAPHEPYGKVIRHVVGNSTSLKEIWVSFGGLKKVYTEYD